MIFPPVPTCHAGRTTIRPVAWEKPRVDVVYGIREPFRRCSYCGGIHPEDLIKFIGEGVAELHGADWKYGWPHKFYVHGIPNKTTETVARVGSTFKNGAEIAILGNPPRECWTKWYNEHITDEGYDDEARSALLSVLESSGITFFMIDGKLRFAAPRPGYQK